jgi:hypothetical protein
LHLLLPLLFLLYHAVYLAGGLGTLTHADTAMSLWREGLKTHLLCDNPAKKAVALQKALDKHKQQQQQQQQQPSQHEHQQLERQKQDARGRQVPSAVTNAQATVQPINFHVKQQQMVHLATPKAVVLAQPAEQQLQQQSILTPLDPTKAVTKSLALQKLQTQLKLAGDDSSGDDDPDDASDGVAFTESFGDDDDEDQDQALLDVGMEQWAESWEGEDTGYEKTEEEVELEQQLENATEDAESEDGDTAIKKLGLSMEKLRQMSRGELLAILKQKVKQFGLSRRQQLKIATDVYRQKRQHRKYGHRGKPITDWPSHDTGSDGDDEGEDNSVDETLGGKHGRRHSAKSRRSRHGARKPRDQRRIEHEERLNAMHNARAARKWVHQVKSSLL